MVLALGKSAREVQTLARAKHRFRSRTGMLEKSVDYQVDREAMSAAVYLDEGAATYAPWVHDGTDPHWILPRAKKALRWTKGGKFVFAKKVWHPGTKPDKFLYEAGEAAVPAINLIFARALDNLATQIDQQIGGGA
ncbi:hypothetical protein HSX37_16190|nr:hypothetical protein [Dendrosporobacter quercicolus DSM 1736]